MLTKHQVIRMAVVLLCFSFAVLILLALEFGQFPQTGILKLFEKRPKEPFIELIGSEYKGPEKKEIAGRLNFRDAVGNITKTISLQEEPLPPVHGIERGKKLSVQLSKNKKRLLVTEVTLIKAEEWWAETRAYVLDVNGDRIWETNSAVGMLIEGTQISSDGNFWTIYERSEPTAIFSEHYFRLSIYQSGEKIFELTDNMNNKDSVFISDTEIYSSPSGNFISMKASRNYSSGNNREEGAYSVDLRSLNSCFIRLDKIIDLNVGDSGIVIADLDDKKLFFDITSCLKE